MMGLGEFLETRKTSWGFDKDAVAMVGIFSKPDTQQKLEILSDDAYVTF